MTSQLDPFAILAALGVRDVEAVTPVAGGADTALWRVQPEVPVASGGSDAAPSGASEAQE